MDDRDGIEGINEVEIRFGSAAGMWDFAESDKSRLGSGCRGPAMMNCQHDKLSADMLNDVDVQLQVRECFQRYRLGMMGNPSTARLLMSMWIMRVLHV